MTLGDIDGNFFECCPVQPQHVPDGKPHLFGDLLKRRPVQIPQFEYFPKLAVAHGRDRLYDRRTLIEAGVDLPVDLVFDLCDAKDDVLAAAPFPPRRGAYRTASAPSAWRVPSTGCARE